MKLKPCSTCKTKPELQNDEHGLWYLCKCKKRTKPFNDKAGADREWNMLNNPQGLPAGCGKLARLLSKWA